MPQDLNGSTTRSFRRQFVIPFNRRFILATAVLAPLLSAAPEDRRDQDGSKLGTFVVVGDSLSAGFQNFSLNDTGQPHGFAAVTAGQAGASLPLPLFSYPGIPPALTLTSTGQIIRAAGVGARENPSVQAYNLSVPGFTVANALSYPFPGSPATNPIDALSDLILATPGTAVPGCGPIPSGSGLIVSEVFCATQLKPDMILIDIGNNDALQALTFGLPPTPAGTFAAEYGVLLGTLAATRAKLVVTNIPDVADIPFLIPVPAFKAACPSPMPPLPSTVTNADFVVANITNPAVVSIDLCTDYAVRSAALVAQTQQSVTAYNAIIATEARLAGATVVDFNTLFAKIAQNGYEACGERLTTAFLGGLFSLDGIHPTNTGYAILANEVIKTMNTQIHAGIPPISVEQVAKTDPLVLGCH
jgi:lysophospholipase L1-like esterase